MKHLALLALVPLSTSLGSCALAGKVIQTPVRLMQAGVRTVTDVGDTAPPATREANQLHGIAVKASECAAD